MAGACLEISRAGVLGAEVLGSVPDAGRVLPKDGAPVLKLTRWELFPDSAVGQSVLMLLHA